MPREVKGVGIPLSVSVADSGDTELVAAETDRKIRVVSLLLVVASAVAVKFKSASTDITGAMSLANNGVLSGSSVYGLFETTAGEALNINLSDAQAVAGCITYVLD